MSDLIKNIMDLAGPSVMNSISDKLGEDSGAVSKAMGGLVPTILGGLLNKSSDAGAMSGIFGMLKNFDLGTLSDLGGLIGGSGGANDAVSGLMGSLFGDKTGGLIDSVASMAGLKKESSSSLMSIAGSMVMGGLGKKIMGDGLDLGGLTSLLTSNKDAIGAAMPSGLASGLGLGSLAGLGDSLKDAAGAVTGAAAGAAGAATGAARDLAGAAGNAASSAAGAATGAARGAADKVTSAAGGGGGGMMKWLIPLLLALGAGWFLMRGCGDADAEKAAADAKAQTEKVAAEAKAAADAAAKAAEEKAKAAKDALGKYYYKLKSGVQIEGNGNGIERQLIEFINSDKAVDKTSWFNFDRLTFATGSANIDMAKSEAQLKNIYSIMMAYPDLKIKVGGYTDNTGSEEVNMKISQQRADAVKAALTKMGVGADRMEAEGYGPAHPVASNDTEEGRAQNRRIAVRVTNK